MDDLTTAWELVIRSGNIDLLRTTLGGVDRAFCRFTKQLKFQHFFNLVFADILHVGQLLNQARGLPRSSNEPFRASVNLGWSGGCCAVLTSYIPQFLIQYDISTCFGAVFSGGCCVLLVPPRRMFTLIASATFGLSALPPSFQTLSRDQSWYPAIPFGGQFTLLVVYLILFGGF